MNRTVRRVLGVVVYLAVAQLAMAGEPLRNAQIAGPTAVVPDSGPEYVVTWDGGEPPWTVVFDATDPGFERRQELSVPSVAVCQSLGFTSGCGTPPISVFYQTPQISEVTATVTDGLGQSISATPLRVRVASDGLFHQRDTVRVDVRPDPMQPGRFLCVGGPEDPVYIDVRGEDPRFPFINVFDDMQLTLPTDLTVFGQPAGGFPTGTLFGIADTDWVNTTFPPPELDIELDFPLQYGDYSDPDTLPWMEPLMPSPALQQLVRYTVRVPTPPECNDGFLTRTRDFFLNPPDIGDPVLVADGDGVSIDGIPVDPDVEEILRAGSTVRFQPQRAAFLGCMELQSLQALVGLSTRLSFDEAIAIMLLEPGALDILRGRCQSRIGNKAEKGPVGATIDAEVQTGFIQMRLVDGAINMEIRAQFASVLITGTETAMVGQEPGGPSTFVATENSLTVTPFDTTYAPQVVQPGTFVTVDATGISPPISTLVFASGFEN